MNGNFAKQRRRDAETKQKQNSASLRLCFAISVYFFAILIFFVSSARAQNLKTAILRVGETKFHEKFRAELGKQNFLRLIDDDLSRSAFRALKYENPFNLSLEEAKNLGAAIDCEFFFIVKSDTVRRSSSARDVYFESYAAVFLASARNGRLAAWEITAEESDAPEEAEKQLFKQMEKLVSRFAGKIQETETKERVERNTPPKKNPIFEISGAETAKNENIRTPLPYKSLKPAYTKLAAHFQIEAAVEVTVELSAKGEVENAEIARWAGYGLDEQAIEIVRKMQFRPALRDGKEIPARFVLRYNFRRPRDDIKDRS
jgi:TonB family protein